MDSLAFVGLGVVIGLFAGLLGVGGGWLLTPTLSIMGFPATRAVGTTLTQMVGTALLGTYRHRKRGKLQIRLALAMMVPLVIGVHLGRYGLELLSSAGLADAFIRGAHLILTLGIGTYMLRETSAARSSDADCPLHQRLPVFGPKLQVGNDQICAYLPISGGLVAGILSGILGIGGGLLLVPMMIYVIGLDVVTAVATNLFCIVFGSLNGAIGYGLAGQVDFVRAGTIVVGSFVGTAIGTSLAHNSDPRVIRRIFSLLLLIMASAISLRILHYDLIARFSIFTGAFTLAIVAMAHAWGRRRNLESGT